MPQRSIGKRIQGAELESFCRAEFHAYYMCFNTHVLKQQFWGASLAGSGLPVRNYQKEPRDIENLGRRRKKNNNPDCIFSWIVSSSDIHNVHPTFLGPTHEKLRLPLPWHMPTDWALPQPGLRDSVLALCARRCCARWEAPWTQRLPPVAEATKRTLSKCTCSTPIFPEISSLFPPEGSFLKKKAKHI